MLTDETIIKVINDCQLQRGKVRGVAVREELMRRFGVRASTDRIYRLLREFRAQAGQAETQKLREQLRSLNEELEAARQAQQQAEERARLAEHREETHLMKWAGELHELREKVAHYEGMGGLRSQAQFESERLRLLMDLARKRQTIEMLTALLEQHGIEVPSFD